jgi:RNA polymerase sigma-B factor
MSRDALTLAAEEEWLRGALDHYAVTRDHTVRDEIAARADWLAKRSAQRFSDRGEPFDDLVQEARIGLLKAIDRFDPGRNLPFGVFATPTIMGELRRHFRDRTWGVHVPRGAKDLRGAVSAARDDLTTELGRSPRVSEIADRLHLPTDAVIDAIEASNAYHTGTLPTADSGQVRSTDAAFDDVLDRQVLTSLLDYLPSRQRRILHLRFFDGLTQAEIAERIGTSQVHVGRLIAASLAELNRYTVEASPDDPTGPEPNEPNWPGLTEPA